ncbi:MAG: hypothetical protein ABR549_14530 [Mycobacteriales bacterium]
MTDYTFDVPADDKAGNRRLLVIAGGAAGLLILGGAGFLLLQGGSSDTSTNVSLPRPNVQHVKPMTTTRHKASAASVKLPVASSVRVGRDPFLALYMAPVAPAASSTGTTTSPTTPTSTTSTTSGTTNTAANQRYTIVLTKITSDPGGAKLFTFKIGTTTKTVLPAQRFGKYGELVVLAYLRNSKGAVTGAVLQVGDDNPIGVPIGVKTSVQ